MARRGLIGRFLLALNISAVPCEKINATAKRGVSVLAHGQPQRCTPGEVDTLSELNISCPSSFSDLPSASSVRVARVFVSLNEELFAPSGPERATRPRGSSVSEGPRTKRAEDPEESVIISALLGRRDGRTLFQTTSIIGLSLCPFFFSPSFFFPPSQPRKERVKEREI